MPDLNAVDRLQPCLLDRLFDDEPRRRSEGKHEKVVSLSRFKEGIKRDIEWLLNSKSRFDHLDSLAFGEVKSSVLNYGVRDFTGLSSENLSTVELERAIFDALSAFEPRILAGTLRVRHLAAGDGKKGGDLQRINALDFEVLGKIWADPMPQDFVVRTEISLEEGAVSVA
jgi:type VI secretion system protein ImpF